jgi:hypothetical protein
VVASPAWIRKRLEQELADAERELAAATNLSDVKAAAKRLQRAKASLKELDTGRPKRPKPA